MVHAFEHSGCHTDAEGRGTIVSPLLGVSLDLAIEGNGIDVRTHLPCEGAGDAPIDIPLAGTRPASRSKR